jgi:hypothetical protein
LENLKDIIKEIMSYEKQLNIKLSPDMVLDCSTRIFISQNIETNKSNKEIIKNKEIEFIPATEKQIWKLKQLDVKIPSNLSKQEAFKLIKENN